MLSFAICATGDALARHEPLYQLDLFVAGVGRGGESSLTVLFVSTVGAFAAVSPPCRCCVSGNDWSFAVVSRGCSLLAFDFLGLGTMLDAPTAWPTLSHTIAPSAVGSVVVISGRSSPTQEHRCAKLDVIQLHAAAIRRLDLCFWGTLQSLRAGTHIPHLTTATP